MKEAEGNEGCTITAEKKLSRSPGLPFELVRLVRGEESSPSSRFFLSVLQLFLEHYTGVGTVLLYRTDGQRKAGSRLHSSLLSNPLSLLPRVGRRKVTICIESCSVLPYLQLEK